MLVKLTLEEELRKHEEAQLRKLQRKLTSAATSALLVSSLKVAEQVIALDCP